MNQYDNNISPCRLDALIRGALATALFCSVGVAHAESIQCEHGYKIVRDVTGFSQSGHLAYQKDEGTVKLYQYGKLLESAKLQDVELYAYNSDGAPLSNYEFDYTKDNFAIFVIDSGYIGSGGASMQAYKLITLAEGESKCISEAGN